MRALVALLPGDGIGPEVTAQAARVLTAVGELYGHSFALREAPVGGIAIDQTGDPLPAETVALCQAADAVLLGAVGGPRWGPSSPVRPEQGLLGLRRALAVFANLRPAVPHPRVAAASPLKPAVLRGVDVLIVRELTGGIYFGEKRREADWAEDLCLYTEEEIARVVRVAARLAQSRRGRLTSVDKANVLETSRLWREVTTRVVREEFKGIELEHLGRGGSRRPGLQHRGDRRRSRSRPFPAQGDTLMAEDPRSRSRAITDGPDRAPARAMLKGIGFTDADLSRPIVGVATTWTETMPCNFHLRRLAERVKEGIRSAGATPMEFNTIAISDGVTMGTEGMKASLVSREVIADSIELGGRGHLFDAMVT